MQTALIARVALVTLSASALACHAEGTGPPAKPALVAAADGAADADEGDEPGASDAGEAPLLSAADAEKRVASVKATFAAQSAHDAERVASFYANDAVVTTPGVPDWEGRDAIREEEAKMFQDARDAKFGLRRILVRDDVAVVEWTSTGTAALSKPRIARRFGANGVSVMLFAPDGLIREEHDIVDSSTLDAQTHAEKRVARETLLQPTGTPDVRVARGTAEEEKNVTAADAFEHAFESRDERAFAGLLTEDFVWDDYTAPSPLRGRAEAVKMFQALTTAFPDMKLTCEKWAIEDFVVEECIRSATHDGPLVLPSRKLPPTHAHVSIHFIEVLQMKHGAVAKASHYADGEELADELRQNAPTAKKKKKKAD